MKTVSRAYDSYAQARAAVDAVEKAGVPSSDVSIVANKYVSAEYADVDDVNKAAAGGAAAGGIVGALADAGTDRDHAEVYSEAVRRGGTLVTARVPDGDAARIEAILAASSPIDPVARGAEYRAAGWKSFDPKAPPYRPNQTEIDRMRANWPG